MTLGYFKDQKIVILFIGGTIHIFLLFAEQILYLSHYKNWSDNIINERSNSISFLNSQKKFSKAHEYMKRNHKFKNAVNICMHILRLKKTS